MTLLYLLDQLFSRQQQKTTRTGFELLVLLITDTLNDALESQQQALEKVKARFPSHKYELLPLHDVFRYLSNLEDIFPLGLRSEPAPKASDLNPLPLEQKLISFLSSVLSTSSRDDLLQTLRLRLVVSYAKENGCDCIVWGDSTTRLAEKTLSETAKGRGFSMPWQTGDGMSPYGVEFKFPMRGLLRKEIALHSTLVSPPLTNLIANEPAIPSNPVSSKNLTIDALMGRYFASVESNYPSIVTNVVRTASRLEAPGSSTLSELCDMCGMPFEVEHGIAADGTNHSSQSLANAATGGISREDYCHGCLTTLLDTDRRK